MGWCSGAVHGASLGHDASSGERAAAEPPESVCTLVESRRLLAQQRQLQWASATEELWEQWQPYMAIGRDGASGGFQGLLHEGAVVYVVGAFEPDAARHSHGAPKLASLQKIDHFHSTHATDMWSTVVGAARAVRHGISGLHAPLRCRVPWCQMMSDVDYPSYMLVSQAGRFAHALVPMQQAFRAKRFLRALKALRLLPPRLLGIEWALHFIARLCSGRELQNGVRYPVESIADEEICLFHRDVRRRDLFVSWRHTASLVI